MSWWTEEHDTPTRAGIYRIRLSYYPYSGWARWDGKQWYIWSADKAKAGRATFSAPKAGYQWRVE